MLGRCSFDSLARKSATRSSSSKRRFTYFGRPSSGEQSFYCSYHSRLERRSFERFHGEIERSNQDNRLDFSQIWTRKALLYIHPFAGSSIRLTMDVVCQAFGATNFESIHDYRLISWLGQQEDTNRIVLYQADYDMSPWTQRCIRQASAVKEIIQCFVYHFFRFYRLTAFLLSAWAKMTRLWARYIGRFCRSP